MYELLPHKPSWLKKKISSGATFHGVAATLHRGKLNTVCQEARCPNLGDCYARGTATFLILGSQCTRACRFCAITHEKPSSLEPDEPLRVAGAVHDLGLSYVVVTSVTRDDIPDGGASRFAETIRAIRLRCPETHIEVLVPDFMGREAAVGTVCEAFPLIIGHNIETVPRLYAGIRPGAGYGRSLNLIRVVKEQDYRIHTKTGLMLGLGETRPELLQVLRDLRAVNCDILTLGQYLQPHQGCVPVSRFVPPDEFDSLKADALAMGFRHVEAGPFVRSSYHAESCLSAGQIAISAV
jgi:lipoic acid synthetase